jgi:hypothetical protein
LPGWDFEALAAGLRRDTDDLSMFAGFLINTLSGGLPAEMVQVEQKKGLFGKAKADAPVLAVSVVFGDRRFVLERQGVGQPVTARIRHESGGIVLRTETIRVDAWSRELAVALADYAQHNAAAVQMLQRLTLPEAP